MRVACYAWQESEEGDICAKTIDIIEEFKKSLDKIKVTLTSHLYVYVIWD